MNLPDHRNNALRKNHGVRLSLAAVLSLLITACASPTPAVQDPSAILTRGAQTVIAQFTQAAPPAVDPAQIQTQAAQTVIAQLTQSAPAPTATELPLAPEPAAAGPVAILPTPAAGEPSAVANNDTTLYSGPGDNYVVYATFQGGQQARVVGKSEDGQWWVVHVPLAPSGSGWVSAAQVSVNDAGDVPVIDTPPVPPSTAFTGPGPDDPQVVALVSTYVRSGPGTNFPAYGAAPAQAKARVLGKSLDGQWWVVRLDPESVGAGYGWVSADTVQASNADQVPAVEAPPAQDVVVQPLSQRSLVASRAIAVEYVNVRSGPGTAYPVLVVAPPGSSSPVAGRSQDSLWWQIRIPDQYAADGLGWVSAASVTAQNIQNVPVVAAPPLPVFPVQPPASNQCQVLQQDPPDNTVLAPDTIFTVVWVLGNTGDTTWTVEDYDLRYLASSVLPMHMGPDVYDLTVPTQPGWTYGVPMTMIAPSEPGTYGEAWAIVRGDEAVCTFWVVIEVR